MRLHRTALQNGSLYPREVLQAELSGRVLFKEVHQTTLVIWWYSE